MTNHRRTALVTLLAILLLASGCGGGAAATSTPTPAPPPTSDSTASADTSVADAWRATATQHRGSDGEEFEYDCPAGGEPATIWGTDIYTDDSSVCTAAVHVGVITVDEGGTVTIEIRPGEEEYEASERNGIESSPYPAWGGSFVVVED